MQHIATSARRRRTRPLLTWAGVVVVSSGLVATGIQAAHAAPSNVLQAVTVDLTGSGAVSGIDSRTLSQEPGSSEVDESTTEHDPTSDTGKLPVRVLTSYRLGDSAGTDLDDLEGKAGRAYINITVQNTTVRPEILDYDSNAQSKQAAALVGVPLTVVASTQLDDTELGQIVTGSAQDQSTDGTTTNGVISRDEDGKTRVQWATILAPPRLASSATLRLVIDSPDIEVPAFDIGVQPGLVTDPSAAGLAESAFGDGSGDSQQLESQTITLLGSVGTALAQASTVLTRVETALDGSAQRIGSATIADLKTSSSDITSALSSLGGDLSSLESQVQSTLDQQQSAAVEELGKSLAAVKANVLGDPAEIDRTFQAPPTPPDQNGCNLTPPASQPSNTVYEQLKVIEAQLDSLQGATTDCSQQIITSIRRNIGNDADTCAAPSALGAVTCATTGLATASTAFMTARNTLTTTFKPGTADEPGLFEKTTTSVRDLITDVQNVRTATDALVLGDQTTALKAQLAEINRIATEQLLQYDGDSSLGNQVTAIQDAICLLPESDERTEALALTTGTDCADQPVESANPAFGDPLSTRIASQQAAWVSIRDLSNPDVIGDLLDQLGDVFDNSADDVKEAVDELWVSNFDCSILDFKPRPNPDNDPQIDRENREGLQAIEDAPSANRLNCQYFTFAEGVQAGQDTLVSNIDEAIRQAGTADGQFRLSRDRIVAARNNAERDSSALFDLFRASLTGIGDGIVDQGRTAINGQRDNLDAQVGTFSDTLSAAVADATDAIGDQVDAANGDLETAEDTLVADLQAILVNIGDPNKAGSGLLGTIYTGARRTGASNDKIADANEATDVFSAVRGTNLDDLFLQQAQLEASLQAQAAYPAFDLELPDSTTHRTVFTYHLGDR